MKRNKKSIRHFQTTATFLWVLLLMSACKKETADTGGVDANSLSYVVADNFNLSILNAVLKYSREDIALKEKGPFTVLAPSDNAFTTMYPTTASVLGADKAVIAALAKYHTLDGRYELNRLPFQFNQELRARSGKMFVTRWVKGGDTVLTVNGARVLARNIPASNGLIQVMNRVLTPYVHEKLGNALAAEPDITLFYQAVVSAGLLETINGAGTYTIFAPDNTAMQALGYATVAQVSDTDPEVLKRLVNYHIIRDRRFVYDYILSSGNAVTVTQNMLDGSPVTISLVANSSEPGGFGGITLRGSGNNTDITLTKQDLLTGNGVLHIIGGALKSF